MIGSSLLGRERKMCELSSVRFAVSPNSTFGGYNSVGRMLALHLLFLLAFDELVFG